MYCILFILSLVLKINISFGSLVIPKGPGLVSLLLFLLLLVFLVFMLIFRFMAYWCISVIPSLCLVAVNLAVGQGGLNTGVD